MVSRFRLILAFVAGFIAFSTQTSSAVIRDGGVDPENLGQGGWLYVISSATNKLGNTVSSVTNEASMFAYLKSQSMNYVIIKAGTSNRLWGSSGNVPIGSTNAQFTSNLVNIAHANGLFVFASTRSWGNDIPGEIAVANYCYQQGADGFIIDAESEWESSQPWIGTNGPALAWQYCSGIRSNWPTKFLAHNPYDTLYLHSSFPFKEFGYWCDSVMPQVYHHSASKANAIAAIHWTDVNYKKFQDFLMTNAPSVINGETIYWTNAIKPLTLMRDVYNGNAGTPVHPPSDVGNFLDYLVADPNCVTAGGYQGSDYFRSELHSSGQWANIKAATIGRFSNVVNNIILDDAAATRNGTWTLVKTIDATTGTVTFSGATGTDTNSFGTNYWTKTQSDGNAYVQFNPLILTAGDYKLYEWHPYRPEASSFVPVTIACDGGTNSVGANQKTNAGAWCYLGTFPFAAGTNGFIRFNDAVVGSSTNIAMVDGIKMIFEKPKSIPAAPSNLGASKVTSTQTLLNWTDTSTNETGFVIFRSTISDGPYAPVGRANRNATTFTDTNVVSGTLYFYVVCSTNFLGLSAFSNEATPATFPIITRQPTNLTIAQFSTAYFDVRAAGTFPLSYQWQRGGTNLFNGGNISGATSANLTMANATTADSGTYSVLISNSYGSTSSISATLTVFTIPPAITAHPLSALVNAGLTTNFSVVATGTPPLSFQWRRNGTNLVNTANITGVTNAILTLSNIVKANEGIYSVAVASPYGNAVSSNATLTVIDPVINSQPVGQTVDAGTTVTFDVVASGTSPLNYQWRKNGTNVVNNARIAGATTSSLTITDAKKIDVGSYTVLVSNSASNTISVAAQLFVFDPIVTLQPSDQTVLPGTTTVLAAGAYGTAPLNFQWTKDGTNVLNGGTISGATTNTLTITSVSPDDQGVYQLLINNSAGSTSTVPVTLIVADSPPIIYAQPTSKTINARDTATFTVVASGTRPLTYQWKFNGAKVLVDGPSVSGATTPSLTLSDVLRSKEGYYTVTISNIYGTLTSSNAGLTVIDPVITSNPTNQTVNAGGVAIFSGSAEGTPFLSYQWKKNGANIVDGPTISGATTSTLTISNVTQADIAAYTLYVSNPVTNAISTPAQLSMPLEIYNVTPVVSGNNAVINWATTSNATTQVEYGATTNMGYFTPLIAAPTINHSVLLSGLKPDTNYYFRVISRFGTLTLSSNSTFTTSTSLIVDNTSAVFSGTWTITNAATDKYGADYRTAQSAFSLGTNLATFNPVLPVSGKYDVYGWFPTVANVSTNLPVIISGTYGNVTSRIDQTTSTGTWKLLAQAKDFSAGNNNYVQIANTTGETNKVVVADAVRWVFDVTKNVPANGSMPAWWSSFYYGTSTVDSAGDTDQDGYSANAEYVIGTIPTDASSKLDIKVQRLGSNTVRAVFSPCLVGRTYDLQYKNDLSSATWLTTQGSLVLSNGQGVVTATNVNTRGFYRLSVTLTP